MASPFYESVYDQQLKENAGIIYRYILGNGPINPGELENRCVLSQSETRIVVQVLLADSKIFLNDEMKLEAVPEKLSDCKSEDPVEKPNTFSDDHYQKMPIQAIDVQEQIIEMNIAIPERARLDIAYGTKYPIRAGIKVGEDWQKDIRKAINYYIRALTGKWAHELDLNVYFKTNKS